MRNYAFYLATITVVGMASTAHASALLKPTSGATQVLQPRAINVETHIDGAWAQTTVTTLYRRKSKQTIEADLLYTAPQGCIITGFAYWHGNEKVTAFVTERDRADELGEASLTSTVDPAWVQLVGKNVFRARLHSIVPQKDLRIEVKLAQPLDNEGGANVWKYPLIADTRDVTLDWLGVSATVANAYHSRNNMGASVTEDDVTVKKYNFKPKIDLRLSLPTKSGPINAQLTTEHVFDARGNAQSDAYFALTLQSPTQIATLPRIEGVETFDILAAERPNPGEIRLFGRYHGKGAATVTWGRVQSVVWFPPPSNAENEVQRLAAPLWGFHELETFAGDSRERLRSIVISKRFNILSRWTSYVAIPAKERADLEVRLQQIDLQRRSAGWGHIWAIEVEKGTPLSPRSLQARAALRDIARSSLGRRYAFNDESARAQAIKARLGELGRLVMASRMNLRPRGPQNEAELKKLAGFALEDVHPYLQVAQDSLRDRQVAKAAQDWMYEVINLRGNTPLAQRLKTQLNRLQQRYDKDDDYANEAYKRGAQQMAYSAFEEAVAGRESGPRATQLIDAGERFAHLCAAGSFETEFYRPVLNSNLQAAGQQLIGEVEAGRADSDAARDAEARMTRIYGLSPNLRSNLRVQGSLEWQVDAARRGLAHEVAYRLAQTQWERPNDRKSLAQLQNQLDGLAAHTEEDSDDFVKAETTRFKDGEPLRSAHDFRLEESGIDPDSQDDETPTKSEPRLQIRPDSPLISLRLPLSTRHAEVVLASGETQDLNWNAQTQRWETHFYEPHFFRAGHLIIGVRTVDASSQVARYSLDLTFGDENHPLQTPTAPAWKIGLWAAANTQRVVVVLPWKARLTLPALPTGQYAATINVPTPQRSQKRHIQFLLVGKTGEANQIALDWN